jgi:uncharacterized protein (DUF433 family)
MKQLTRITFNPEVMGGKPCIRGMRVTVGTVVGLMASGRTIPEILKAYPYLEEADIYEALSYAAWRVEEIDQQTLTEIQTPPSYRPASGRSILRHVGKWQGDDFEECLQMVYDSRGNTQFNKHINPFE